jgi:hypothetical protein
MTFLLASSNSLLETVFLNACLLCVVEFRIDFVVDYRL